MRLIFLTFFILSSAVQLYASFKEFKRLKAYSKGFVMASLIGYYLMAAQVVIPSLVIALLLCLGGDLLLIRSNWLVQGGIAFALGHLMYVDVFRKQMDLTGSASVGYAAAFGYLTIIIAMMHFLWPHIRSKKLKFGGAFYLLAVCSMSCFALFQMLYLREAASVLIWIGSLLFIASDFLLLVRNFRSHTNIKHKPFLVMLSYIAAQASIVFGTLLLR